MMEENEEVAGAEEFEEIEASSIKVEQGDNVNEEDGTAEYLELDLDMEAISQTQEYYVSPPKSRRGRRKKVDVKSPSQSALLKSNYDNTAELKLRPKYRPIRPKPYQPSLIGRNKMVGMTPTVNVSTLNSQNRFIVTAPLSCKEKVRDAIVMGNANVKPNSYIKPTTGVVNEKSPTGNSTGLAMRKDLRNTKTPAKSSSKGSIELFFESMAQTVLNLPMHVQAEIKMEICKLVAMAEIKYSLSEKQNYKNG